MTHTPQLIVFGEILWDMLPSGPQPGGAPANVAVQARACGIDTLLITAVGDDDPGRQMLARLRERDLPADGVQIIPGVPTGAVEVTLKGQGMPDYRIHTNVAWDQIALVPALRAAAQNARAICFGSLAQRAPVSRDTLRALLDLVPVGCQRFFDVNLRRPWPDFQVIELSLCHTDILKLNDEELPIIADMLKLPTDANAFAPALFEKYPVHTMLMTMGSRGAALFARDMLHSIHIPPAPVEKIVDTVGAGDAFSAGYLAAILIGRLPESAARSGSALASRICAISGAWLPPGEHITL